MAADDDLIALIRQDCLTISQDDVRFCRLMRYSVRKLLGHSAALALLQTHQAPPLVIGFDIAPRLARALRIAAHAINGGALIPRAHNEGSIVVRVECLRAAALGPRLRPLAVGHLLLSGHSDSERDSRSVFAFIGVYRDSTDRLQRVVQSITPALHRALLNVQHSRIAGSLSLTPAEKAICRLLVAGAHNKEIAKQLRKSNATVRNQLHAIFPKLGVATRTAAAAKLRELPPAFFAAENARTLLVEHWPIQLHRFRTAHM